MKRLLLLLSFFLTVLVVYVHNGCSEVSSTSGTVTYPAVAKDWTGSETMDGCPTCPTSLLTAAFTQNNEVIKGSIIHSINALNLQVKDSVTGTITLSKQISLNTISYSVLQGTPSEWFLNQFTGVISKGLDTISGTWKDSGGYMGTFILVKN